MLQGVIDRLQAAGLVKESEGALIVEFEQEKLPVGIVRKSDGGYNYATTDIATIISRNEEFRPEKIVYVTDERQQLHFSQVFSICRRLGIKVELQHVWFGLMRLPEGTFSTREGNVIPLERMLDEAEGRALAIVMETSPEMSPDQQREVARKVGIGALKYADLSQNPQTMIVFSWDKALSLDGNSGPYLQYAYARISSVRDKYSERFGQSPDSYPVVIGSAVERELVLRVCRYPEVVLKAALNFRPNYIAEYLYDLAQAYSSFYQNLPFLKAEEGVRESRVRICGMVARVLKAGLSLLGIDTPERI
jgi:arginyl-tRNA synthetase